jgi:hypothetical protein
VSDSGGGWSWLRSTRARELPVALLVSVGILFCAGGSASASRPDGRAWEMVSPLEKNSGDIRGIDGISAGGVVQAAADGGRITYVSLASFGDPQGAAPGSQYVSDRGAAEWEAQNISTSMNAQTYGLAGEGTPYEAFSSDLSSGLMFGGLRFAERPVENPPLADAPAGYQNYYLRTIPTIAEAGSAHLEALLTHATLLAHAPSLPPEAFSLEFLGATPDLKHIVVSSTAGLGGGAVEAEGASNLYGWTNSAEPFQPLNILPNGAPDPENGLLLGGSGGATGQAISTDGSRVVWTGLGLYVREGIGTGHARTVQADAPAGGGRFLTASSDGSKVFFADGNALTGESTAGGGGLGDLYKFEPASRRLVDLAVDHVDPEGAEVQGVLGASEDGSYLYFVANGVLPGALGTGAASPGNCAYPVAPPEATCNLYVWHEGETRFITRLASNDESGAAHGALGVAFDWDSKVALRTVRVSRDGTRLLFMSERSLTGYDNTVSTGESCGKNASGESLPAQCGEVFLYEANADRLSCASCNPGGARPIGPSGIPGGTEFSSGEALHQSRALSEDAAGVRVLFDSADALVPQDTNGKEDVYEYENGHVYLLSGGESAGGASFVDASTNGDDAFFITRAPLVGQDTDQLVDLYDARAPHTPGEAVGFPAPPPPAVCEGEDCRPAGPSAPVYAPLSSATFTGMGNTVPAASTPVAKPKPKKAKPKKRKKKGKRGKKANAGRASGIAKGRR